MDDLDKIWTMPGNEIENFCRGKGWPDTSVEMILTNQFKDHPVKCLHYLIDALPAEKRELALVYLMMVFEMK